MTAYRDALRVDEESTEERLGLAMRRLQRCEGVVLFGGALALRPTAAALVCEVIDRAPDSHRCAEEFKVMIENAGRQLATSRLAAGLPRKPMHWVVVEDDGSGTTTLFSGTPVAAFQ